MAPVKSKIKSIVIWRKKRGAGIGSSKSLRGGDYWGNSQLFGGGRSAFFEDLD
jgi:hypothetical protein